MQSAFLSSSVIWQRQKCADFSDAVVQVLKDNSRANVFHCSFAAGIGTVFDTDPIPILCANTPNVHKITRQNK